MVWGLNNTT